MRARWGRSGLLAIGAALGFVLLTALVAGGATRGTDVSLLGRLRPADEWGSTQVRLSPWIDRLAPARMFAVLAGVTLLATVLRRSWRPLVSGVLVAGCTMVLTAAVKLALERPDPHGAVPVTGGSYPSGHMAAVVACLVGCLLVLRPRLSVWHFVPAGVAAVVLGVGQLVSAAHWPSDLLGGALLALVVVGATRPVDPGRDRVPQGDGAALQHSDGVPQRTPR